MTDLRLLEAVEKGKLEEIKRLIEGGTIDINAKVGTWQDTALHCAAKRGMVYIMDLLIKNGADVNITNKDELTAYQILKDYCGERALNDLISGIAKHPSDLEGRVCFDEVNGEIWEVQDGKKVVVGELVPAEDKREITQRYWIESETIYRQDGEGTHWRVGSYRSNEQYYYYDSKGNKTRLKININKFNNNDEYYNKVLYDLLNACTCEY